MNNPEELFDLSGLRNELSQEVFGLVEDGVRLIWACGVACVTET